jgi:cytochrome c-type biogenesis protein CcmH/NrfF
MTLAFFPHWPAAARAGARRHSRVALLVLAAAWVVLPGRAAGDPDLEARYREAASRLVCQCSCNEQLTVCAMQNCPSATPMRAEIRKQLAAGTSVDAIVADFVKRMGKQVLSAPTLEGFDLAAWIAPFAMLVLGTVLVGWIVTRMARRPSEPAPSGAPQPAADPADPRIEAELRDFEEDS